MQSGNKYPTIDMVRTGRNLKKICEEKNISILMLQDYLGFACPQSIYRWFYGKALPSVDNLFALSHLFEMPMEKLLIKEQLVEADSFFFVCKENKIINQWNTNRRMLHYKKIAVLCT